VTTHLLSIEAVRLGRAAADKSDAIRQAGQALLDVGAVEPAYLESMQERERSITTYIGEGVAIPHGTDAGRALVRRTALSFVQFPDGVEWNDGERAMLCIGIAASGNEHTGVLAALARVLLDSDKAEALRTAKSPDDVLRLLEPEPEEEK
jgi:mannitol/fructose-specific phosphotransferase system IIA component